jgi:hypothetical protein
MARRVVKVWVHGSVLAFRDMPNLRILSTLSYVLVMLSSAAFGQSGTTRFKSGEWQINSTVTADGRAISSQQRVRLLEAAARQYPICSAMLLL